MRVGGIGPMICIHSILNKTKPLHWNSNFEPCMCNARISNFNREPCHAESTAINFFLFISYYISLLYRVAHHSTFQISFRLASRKRRHPLGHSKAPHLGKILPEVWSLRLPQRIFYFVMLCAPRAFEIAGAKKTLFYQLFNFKK